MGKNMQLQSVKETARRFNISERRVQKLCETGRIKGAQMISNVWVIPSTAKKPADERHVYLDKNMLSLSDACKELSISVATGRNWVKLGKLIPDSTVKNTLLFKRKYIEKVKRDIQTGKNSALKNRRNKKHVSGNNIYHSYVSDESSNVSVIQSIFENMEKSKVMLTEDIMCALIAECAIQLIVQKNNGKSSHHCLSAFLKGEFMENEYIFLVTDILREHPAIEKTIENYPELFNVNYVYEDGEDILGLLYISLKNIGSRKTTGTYYTPTKIVKKLCNHLCLSNDINDKDILDPCCGTGNFLLQLPFNISYKHVFGNDNDAMSVKLARINYALKYDISDKNIIYKHITESNYLNFDTEKKFDYIIGNPPWGYEFSTDEKQYLRKKFLSAAGTAIESYDVFVEQALLNLNKDGVIAFILPEAILNVRTHTPIRELLLAECSFQYLEFLGNAFDKVQCPCIILQLIYTKKPFCTNGMTVNDGVREYVICKSRKVNSGCISFTTTDDEYDVIEKIDNIPNKVILKGKSRFALGIVTGNNKEHISQNKTEQNEMILKGSDLCKFKTKASGNYIEFRPELYQQVAPVELYRMEEKLLYRFICNQLVFAYDNKKTLSLNSCNILIPEIDGLDIKYIMAVLNSRVLQFYFKKQFNSVKVLRSHIEQLPIPQIGMDLQNEIIKIVEELLMNEEKNKSIILYDKLDFEISKLYGLTAEEYSVIKASIERENLFLY